MSEFQQNDQANDDEFADFLNDVTASNEQRELIQLQKEQFQREADETLDKHAIFVPFRYDTERCAQIAHEYYMALKEEFSSGVPEENILPMGEESSEVMAEYHTANDQAFVVKVLAFGMMAKILYTFDCNDPQITPLKKKIMAECHVERGVQFDSEFMAFLDEFVPGQTLDPRDFEDAMYIGEAQKQYDKSREILNTLGAIIDKHAKEELGEVYTDDEFVKFQRFALECQGIAVVPGARIADREEAIESLVRRHGYSRVTAESLMHDLMHPEDD